MQNVLVHAVKTLQETANPWKSVVDPAGAFLMTLGRLGWCAASARHLFTEQGVAVDLLGIAPKALYDMVDNATRAWGDWIPLKRGFITTNWIGLTQAALARRTGRMDLPAPLLLHQDPG